MSNWGKSNNSIGRHDDDDKYKNCDIAIDNNYNYCGSTDSINLLDTLSTSASVSIGGAVEKITTATAAILNGNKGNNDSIDKNKKSDNVMMRSDSAAKSSGCKVTNMTTVCSKVSGGGQHHKRTRDKLASPRMQLQRKLDRCFGPFDHVRRFLISGKDDALFGANHSQFVGVAPTAAKWPLFTHDALDYFVDTATFNRFQQQNGHSGNSDDVWDARNNSQQQHLTNNPKASAFNRSNIAGTSASGASSDPSRNDAARKLGASSSSHTANHNKPQTPNNNSMSSSAADISTALAPPKSKLPPHHVIKNEPCTSSSQSSVEKSISIDQRCKKSIDNNNTRHLKQTTTGLNQQKTGGHNKTGTTVSQKSVAPLFSIDSGGGQRAGAEKIRSEKESVPLIVVAKNNCDTSVPEPQSAEKSDRHKHSNPEGADLLLKKCSSNNNNNNNAAGDERRQRSDKIVVGAAACTKNNGGAEEESKSRPHRSSLENVQLLPNAKKCPASKNGDHQTLPSVSAKDVLNTRCDGNTASGNLCSQDSICNVDVAATSLSSSDANISIKTHHPKNQVSVAKSVKTQLLHDDLKLSDDDDESDLEDQKDTSARSDKKLESLSKPGDLINCASSNISGKKIVVERQDSLSVPQKVHSSIDRSHSVEESPTVGSFSKSDLRPTLSVAAMTSGSYNPVTPNNGSGGNSNESKKPGSGDKSRAWNLNSFMEILTPTVLVPKNDLVFPTPEKERTTAAEVLVPGAKVGPKKSDDVTKKSNIAAKSAIAVSSNVFIGGKTEAPDVSAQKKPQMKLVEKSSSSSLQHTKVSTLSSSSAKSSDVIVTSKCKPSTNNDKNALQPALSTKISTSQKVVSSVVDDPNNPESHRKRKKLKITPASLLLVPNDVKKTTVVNNSNSNLDSQVPSPGKENIVTSHLIDASATSDSGALKKSGDADTLSPTSRAKDSWSRHEELRAVLEKSRLSPLLSPIREFPGLEFKNGRPSLMCRLPLSLLKNVPPNVKVVQQQKNQQIGKVPTNFLARKDSAFSPFEKMTTMANNGAERKKQKTATSCDLDDVPISERRRNSKCQSVDDPKSEMEEEQTSTTTKMESGQSIGSNNDDSISLSISSASNQSPAISSNAAQNSAMSKNYAISGVKITTKRKLGSESADQPAIVNNVNLAPEPCKKPKLDNLLMSCAPAKAIIIDFTAHKDSSNFFIAKAKEVKHQADAMSTDRLLKAITYLESICYFFLTGYWMEKTARKDNNMAKDTRELLQSVVIRKLSQMNDLPERTQVLFVHKFEVLAMRLDALLYSFIFSKKQHQAWTNYRHLNEYQQAAAKERPSSTHGCASSSANASSQQQGPPSSVRSTGDDRPSSSLVADAAGTPSVNGNTTAANGTGATRVTPALVGGGDALLVSSSSTPSPASSTGSSSHSLPPGLVAIPQHIDSMYRQQLTVLQNLFMAYHNWAQADVRLRQHDIPFFAHLDSICRPLSLTSSVQSACSYFLTAVQWLRIMYEQHQTQTSR